MKMSPAQIVMVVVLAALVANFARVWHAETKTYRQQRLS